MIDTIICSKNLLILRSHSIPATPNLIVDKLLGPAVGVICSLVIFSATNLLIKRNTQKNNLERLHINLSGNIRKYAINIDTTSFYEVILNVFLHENKLRSVPTGYMTIAIAPLSIDEIGNGTITNELFKLSTNTDVINHNQLEISRKINEFHTAILKLLENSTNTTHLDAEGSAKNLLEILAKLKLAQKILLESSAKLLAIVRVEKQLKKTPFRGRIISEQAKQKLILSEYLMYLREIAKEINDSKVKESTPEDIYKEYGLNSSFT